MGNASLVEMALADYEDVGKGLNDMQRELFEDAFRMFDKDGSGTIDCSEFRDVCRQIGIIPTDSELQMMIEEIDTDNSGDIDMDEFVNAISNKMVDAESEDHIRAAFQMFDNDDSGHLSRDEIHEVLLHLGDNLTPDVIDKLISIADVDSDGQIDAKEFVAMVLDRPYIK